MNISPTLFQSTSNFIASEKLTEAGTLILKGIFSTDLLDRTREVVDPLEFNLHVFQNTATLLRNHEFIVDDNGNKHSAGKVLKTIPVVVSQENPEDASEWVFKSLVSEDIIAMWPKAKSPNLLVGDRAVYIVTEVTHQEVIKQVLNKELGAFSWSGLTRKEKRLNGVTDLKAIDLLEVSLVNIPANPDATFMLSDENDPTLNLEISLKDCEVYQMRFDKNQYPLDSIMKITKNLNIDTSTISENESSFFIKLGESNLVEPVKCFSFGLGQWDILAAPKTMNKKQCKLETIHTTKLSEEIMSEDVKNQTPGVEKVEVEKLYLIDIQEFMKANPKAVVSVQKTITLGEAPVEINTIEMPVFEETQEEVSDVVEPTEEVIETPAEAVETAVADEAVTPEAVAPVADDRLDKLTDLVANLTNVVAQNMVKKEEESAAVEKSVAQIKADMTKEFEAKFAKFKKDEEAVNSQREKLQKSLEKLAAFETVVPDETQRSEKLETSKSFDDQPIDAKAFFANQILKGVK